MGWYFDLSEWCERDVGIDRAPVSPLLDPMLGRKYVVAQNATNATAQARVGLLLAPGVLPLASR
ncbi:MAG: hypothetical protein ABEJ06_04265 [Haloarculaceae archaeon]